MRKLVSPKKVFLFDLFVCTSLVLFIFLFSPLTVQSVTIGDLDNDCNIDIADYQIFRTLLFKCSGDAGYDAIVDYDGDSCISYRDYQIWYGYFRRLPKPDEDHDGVIDSNDLCPGTLTCAVVDGNGCSLMPSIIQLTPPTATPGTTLTITGTNFDTSTQLSLNGTPAQLITRTDTQLKTSIPLNAATGPVTVTTANGTATSSTPLTVSIITLDPIPPTAYIRGTISDALTDAPIENAVITIKDLPYTIYTDAAGSYEYPVPQGGEYIIFIEKQGYITTKQIQYIESTRTTLTGPVYMTPYDTKYTYINAATGGTATDSTGTIEIDFPPGVLPHDINLSATRFWSTKGYPVPIPKGQVFVDSIQFDPEHITFNGEATVRVSNRHGFAPGTKIPFAFGMHDADDPMVEVPYFDPGTAQVTADGQWVEFKTTHFSCPSFILPPGPPVGSGAPQNSSAPFEQPQWHQLEQSKNTGAAVNRSDGNITIDYATVPYRTLGQWRNITLTYNSATAQPGTTIAVELDNSALTADPIDTNLDISIEGVNQTVTYNAATDKARMAYFTGGQNSPLSTLRSGTYYPGMKVQNNYQANFFTTDTFGGPPVSDTGVQAPNPVPLTNNLKGAININNQQQSPFGWGWSMRGLKKLVKNPDDSVLILHGSGETSQYRPGHLPGQPAVTATATGFSYPVGVIYDPQENIYVTDTNANTVYKITPDGTKTPLATISQPTGIAYHPDGYLYVASKNEGNIYQVNFDGSTAVFVTLPPFSPYLVQDIALDSQNNLYVYDTGGSVGGALLSHAVYKVGPSGIVNTLITGQSKLLVSSIAISPNDELYMAFNNAGFLSCSASFITKFKPGAGLTTVVANLNSPAGMTFDGNGSLYVIDRSCATNNYHLYTIDRSGNKTEYLEDTLGTDPNFTLAQLNHDIAFGPNGQLAIISSSQNQLLVEKGFDTLAPPPGNFSLLTPNQDGSHILTTKDGIVTRFDTQGLMTSVSDRNGNTTTYTYTPDQKLIAITGPVVKTISFSYAPTGRLQYIYDPSGRTTFFEHDPDGNLTKITNPDTTAVQYTYTPEHLLTTKTTPGLGQYTYTYNTLGRIQQITDPEGAVTQLDPGQMQGLVNDLSAGQGTQTTPAQIVSPEIIADILINTDGDINQNKTAPNGSLMEIINELGQSTSFQRNRHHHPTSITNPKGISTSMDYDLWGNLTTSKEDDTTAATTYTYEPNFNQVATITDPLGNTTAITYDANGNLLTTTDALGNTTTNTYNTRGQILATTNALNQTTTMTYDTNGNLLTTTDPLGNTTSNTYNTAGNLTSTTDAESNTTTYQYDTLNRLTSVTDPYNNTTTYTYIPGSQDTKSNLVAITDAKSNTTTMTYDKMDRLISTSNPGNLIKTYTYDDEGNMITSTDPKGQTITYTYDELTRLITKTLPDDTVNYIYDETGNILSIRDNDSRVTMDYDSRNRLIQSLQELGGSDPKTFTTPTIIEKNNMYYDYRDITVDGTVLTVVGPHTFTSLTLKNNAVLTHIGATITEEDYLDITITGDLTIEATSQIDVTGKGYLGAFNGDNNSNYGRTLGNTQTGGSSRGSGGSYGGLGGQLYSYSANVVYGSLYNPDELGSGGGGIRNGGNGGGLIKITATGIILNGSIKADGADGADYNNNGGGSGGGIHIQTGTLSGTGMIGANGGKGFMTNTSTAGGGGGRIAIYYDDISGFNTANITAYGGTGSDDNGGAGTIYLKSSSQTYGDLIIDNNNLTTKNYSTPLISAGAGTSTVLTAQTLTDDTKNWRKDDLIGIYLNPNKYQTTVFKILTNTPTNITTDTNDGDMTTDASIGGAYTSGYILDNLDIKGQASVSIDGFIKVLEGDRSSPDTLTIDGQLKTDELNLNSTNLIADNTYLETVPVGAKNITFQNNSTLSHPSATTTATYSLIVDITGDLTIDATSQIDVTGKGYLGAFNGDNNTDYGRTLGNTTTGGSVRGSGGSYGGLGGQVYSYNVDVVYGSLYNPDELGSGGGGFNYGGNGGGLIKITAAGIILNGSIKADGADGADYNNNGGGSGGGIHIQTGTLSGTGMIGANGGKGFITNTSTAGGGGGRIAIYYDDISGFNTANITAYGGIGQSANGGAGTIFLKSSTQQYGDLVIDNNNIATDIFSTPLVSVGAGIATGLTADTLAHNTRDWATSDLIGIYLNPNIGQSDAFKIIGNNTDTIIIDTNNGGMTTVASIGDTYRGKYIFDHLYIRGGASVETGDDIEIIDPVMSANIYEMNWLLKANSLEIDNYSLSSLSIINGGLFVDILPDTLNNLTLSNSTLVVYNDLNALTIITGNNSNLTVGGFIQADNISVTENSSITHPNATTNEEYKLVINAANLTIDFTSRINVSGKGYLGGYRGDNNGEYGRTLGNTTTGGSSRYSGGSYGGLGSKYDSNEANDVYGDLFAPIDLGSGGGGYSGIDSGGNGGGSVKITAGTILLDGSITSNGEDAYWSGGGSGGSIYIKTNILSGSGWMLAKGGDSTHNLSKGAGGGGRIAIFYNDISDFNSDNIDASGGISSDSYDSYCSSSFCNGGSGTIFIKSSNQIFGDLIVDNNNLDTVSNTNTPLRSIGSGTITDLTLSILTDNNANFQTPDSNTGALGVTGLKVDPNTDDGDFTTLFAVIDNTSATLTTDLNDGDMNSVAAIGDTYSGVYTIDNLILRDKANISTNDIIVIMEALEQTDNSTLDAPELIDNGTSAPIVKITFPTERAEYLEGSTIPIAADANDDIGVAAVNFLIDGTVVYTDNTIPYLFDYTIPLGITELTIGATAVDSANNTGTATDVNITVIFNSPPVVDIITPADSSYHIEGSTIDIQAQAEDTEGIEKVEFLIDGLTISFDYSFPYTAAYTIPGGISLLNIKGTATDNLGKESTSEVNINVVSEDPLTTVFGRVMDIDGNPVSNAVITNGDLSSISGSDGTFFIVNGPAVLGDIVVTVSVNINGSIFTGVSSAASPVPGGTTDVGDIVVVGNLRVTDNTANSYQPVIALDSNDNIHIAWMDDRDGNYEIYYKMLSKNGEILIDDTRLTFNSTNSIRPYIVVDSTNKVHIVWQDYLWENQIFYTKIDPGLDDQNGDAALDETISVVDELVLSGNWYSYMGENHGITIDSNDNIHVVWSDIEMGELYYLVLNSAGTIIAPEWTIAYNYSDVSKLTIAVDFSGAAHVVWSIITDNNYEIFYKMIVPGTTIIDTTKLTSSDGKDSKWPSILMGTDNRPYIVWQDDKGSNTEIYLMKIDPSLDDMNGDAADPSVIKVMDDAPLTPDDGNESNYPTVAIDANDNIHVTWYENWNGNRGSLHYEMVNNNGNILIDDIELTNSAVTTTNRTSAFLAPAVSSNRAYITWADNQDGNSEVYLRSIYINKDFTTVAGKIVNESGEPVSSANVIVESDSGSYNGISEPDGTFLISGVLIFLGEEITVNASGQINGNYYSGASDPMQAVPDSTTNVGDITLTVVEAGWWVARYNSHYNYSDAAYAMAVDAGGNVYVTGESYDSNGYSNYATVKYDTAGSKLWVAVYNGPANDDDYAGSITVDNNGNVYVTGESYDSNGYSDYATVKYDTNGNELWVARYDGPANDDDYPKAIAVDNNGNVYVSGKSYSANGDYLTVKYDTNGNELWTARYNGPANRYDSVRDMTIDAYGNVYVTGLSYNSASGYDISTIKYDTNGNELWVTIYNGPANGFDAANAIAVDSYSNIYVTGGSSNSDGNLDYITVKYDTAGNELWVAIYNGPGDSYDNARAIAIDPDGNAFVTGASLNSSTFSSLDYLTMKYDTNGNELWAARYNGPGDSYDNARAIAIDPDGNAFVTGISYGSGNNSDYASIKYDSAGNELWVARYDGPANGYDSANAIAIDPNGNVYVTGESDGGDSSYDYCTIKLPLTETGDFIILGSLDSQKTNSIFAALSNSKPEHKKQASKKVTFNTLSEGSKTVERLKPTEKDNTVISEENMAMPDEIKLAQDHGIVSDIPMTGIAAQNDKFLIVADTGKTMNLLSRVTLNNEKIQLTILEVDTKLTSTTPVTDKQTRNPAQVTAKSKNNVSGIDPQYTYDKNGNRTSMQDPIGTQFYEYDALNRLTKITNPFGEITTFQYDAIGRRTGMNQHNGATTTYSYDDAGRLLSLVNQIGATNISTFSYTYDQVGNRTSMVDKYGVNNYVYDDLYRLVQATHPQPQDPAEQFNYDPVGNRIDSHLSTTHSVDNMNRLHEDDNDIYTYDSNGNTTQKISKTTGEVENFNYDSENKLTSYEKVTSITNPTPITLASHYYDGLGRRIAKTVDGNTTKFIYDINDIILDLNGNDLPLAKYTRSLNTDDIISVRRDTEGNGQLDTSYYYHKDGLASVTEMTDNLGTLTQSYRYDSFGNTLALMGSIDNRYRYTGREWDDKTKIYYYRARFYNPDTGRFLNEDPIAFGGGINFYTFVKNRPITFTDPFGLCGLSIENDEENENCTLASYRETRDIGANVRFELEPLDPVKQMLANIISVVPAGFFIDIRTEFRIQGMRAQQYDVTDRNCRDKNGNFVSSETISAAAVPGTESFQVMSRQQRRVQFSSGGTSQPLTDWY